MRKVLAMVLIACGDGDTALRVRVDFEPGVSVQQLRFSGASGERAVFGPELRPDLAGPALQSGDALVVLLPDELASRLVRCIVDGLWRGSRVASGSGMARVELGREVECVAALQPSPPEADAGAVDPCTGCYDGDGDCRRGTENDRCGIAGALCVKCPSGTECFAGGVCN